MDWDEGPGQTLANTVLTVNQNVNTFITQLIELLIAEDKAYKCYMTEGRIGSRT